MRVADIATPSSFRDSRNYPYPGQPHPGKLSGMATTVLPLSIDPSDDVAQAELERMLMGLSEAEHADLAEQVRLAVKHTPPAQRRHLVIVEHRDDTHLLEPLEWEGDHLLPAPRRRLDVELRTT